MIGMRGATTVLVPVVLLLSLSLLGPSFGPGLWRWLAGWFVIVASGW